MDFNCIRLDVHRIGHESSDQIAVLTLSRPETANAFDAMMIAEITNALDHLKSADHLRCLVLRAEGKHFCGGADLAWMKNAAQLSYQENLDDAAKLKAMFESFITFPIPTLAIAHGAAFGGAVGLLACCDFVLGAENSKFCLSEVRLGILPAVIMPYLCQKMQPGPLKRLMLTGQVFTTETAFRLGLVDVVIPGVDAYEQILVEINALLLGAPEAQRRIKSLYRALSTKGFQQDNMTKAAIAEARTSLEGQNGFKSFFAKETPPWQMELKSVPWQIS
jgi:methylglutaconyl-CoA hydratase